MRGRDLDDNERARIGEPLLDKPAKRHGVIERRSEPLVLDAKTRGMGSKAAETLDVRALVQIDRQVPGRGRLAVRVPVPASSWSYLLDRAEAD